MSNSSRLSPYATSSGNLFLLSLFAKCSSYALLNFTLLPASRSLPCIAVTYSFLSLSQLDSLTSGGVSSFAHHLTRTVVLDIGQLNEPAHIEYSAQSWVQWGAASPLWVRTTLLLKKQRRTECPKCWPQK